MVANSANLIITVKPASQKNNISKNYRQGYNPEPVRFSKDTVIFMNQIFSNVKSIEMIHA